MTKTTKIYWPKDNYGWLAFYRDYETGKCALATLGFGPNAKASDLQARAIQVAPEFMHDAPGTVTINRKDV